jgi:hypothetical protein
VGASVPAEVMVRPLERGTDLKVDEFLDAAKVEVIDADRTLARRAAQLRARHRSLRLGDALSLATVGTDLRFPEGRSRWPRYNARYL